MKLYIYFIVIFIIVFAFSCSQKEQTISSEKVNQLLDKYQLLTDSLLFSIWDYCDLQIDEIAKVGFSEKEIRYAMNKILSNFSQIYEVVYVNNKGVLLYAEPSGYRLSEGTDISKQEHIKTLFKANKRGFSYIFKLVEGYYANIMKAPIIKDGKCIGSISPIFKTDKLINSIIKDIEKKVLTNFYY